MCQKKYDHARIDKNDWIYRSGVRYLIAEGFVPSPGGGRANAEYRKVHLVAIKRYQLLRKAGFSPASIRLLLESQTGVPFQIIPGVSLIVDPHLIAERLPSDDIVKQIVSIRKSHMT